MIHAAEYDDAEFRKELLDVEKLLKEKGNSVTISALEERAKSRKPDDFYYKNGDAVSKAAVTRDKAK